MTQMSFQQRLLELGFSSYKAYLNSDLWIGRRTLLAHGRETCFVCDSKQRLHLHHATYVRLGRELPSDIVLLCQTHHHELHAFIKATDVELLVAHIRYRALTEDQRQAYSKKSSSRHVGPRGPLTDVASANLYAQMAEAINQMPPKRVFSTKELAQLLGVRATYVGSRMATLRRRGQVQQISKKRWRRP